MTVAYGLLGTLALWGGATAYDFVGYAYGPGALLFAALLAAGLAFATWRYFSRVDPRGRSLLSHAAVLITLSTAAAAVTAFQLARADAEDATAATAPTEAHPHALAVVASPPPAAAALPAWTQSVYSGVALSRSAQRHARQARRFAKRLARRASRHAPEPEADQAALSAILLFLLSAAVLYGTFALSCSLSCAGNHVLAVLAAAFGIYIVAVIWVTWSRRRKRRRARESTPEPAG